MLRCRIITLLWVSVIPSIAAADWANQALEIDVKDAESHGVFAEALASVHNYADALFELAPDYPGADALLESLKETDRDGRSTGRSNAPLR